MNRNEEDVRKLGRSDFKIEDFERVVKGANAVGVLSLVIAVFLLVRSLVVPVASKFALEIYARNYSTIACFVAVGFFLLMWIRLVSDFDEKFLRWYRVAIVVAGVFALAKCLVSLGLAVFQSFGDLYIIIYYGFEALAWLALALFLVYCFVRAYKKRWDSSPAMITKVLFDILVVVCFVKMLSSMFYAVFRFSPSGMGWIFFLADAVGWGGIAAMMLIYRGECVV